MRPDYEEVYDLANGVLLAAGIPYQPKPVSEGAPQRRLSPAYKSLEEAGDMLQQVIKRSTGRPNKDLQKFASQLKELIDKFEN